MRAMDPKRQVKTLLGGRMLAAAVTTLAALCLCSAAAFGQCTLTGTVSTWNDGNSNWNTASNWTPTGVPNSSSNSVCITNGTSTVTLDISPSIDSLQLAHGNTLSFNGNTQLSVFGSQIINGGSILVNGGGGTNTWMFIDGSTTLSGGGTLTLSNTASGGGGTFLYANNGAATLTNQSTIQGEGTFGDNTALGVNNTSSGIINANSTGGVLNTTLLFQTQGAVTNAGLMEATNSGVLDIQSTTINNAGGNITAKGSTATVELVSADIQGGTLNTTTGGTFETVGSATLDGSTHGALTLSTGSTYTGALGSQTTALGTINNNGNIQLNGGASTNTILLVGSNTTLQGTGGTVTLNTTTTGGGGNVFIQDSVSGVTLTNTNNIIQGEGIIGNGGSIALINQSGGTINANSTGSPLTTVLEINPVNGVTNTGLLESSNSGVLDIQSTTVNNAGGTIKSNGASSTVELVSATVQGGTLTNTSGFLGTPQGNVATLDGSNTPGAITLKGTYTSDLNSQTTLLGTINNDNNIQVNGGANTNSVLVIGGGAGSNKAVTLQGGGTVNLSTTTTGGGGNAYIEQSIGGVTLTNVNNTIQGEGIIGNNGLTLINQSAGIINANSTGGALISTLTLDNGPITNQGLLEATNSGVLQIDNPVVNNAVGTISANGASAVVQLFGGAVIQGGTLNNNGGTLGTPAGNVATLDGSTTAGAITLKGTYLSDLNTETTLLGTINNDNSIQLNGGANTNSILLIGGGAGSNTAVTLQGGGTVNLSTTTTGGGGNAYIEQNIGGVTLTNVNNTIQGEGIIGNNGLTLINQSAGIINANSTGGALISTLTLDNGPITNQGLMEATQSGELLIQSATINNLGGNITANGSMASVQLNAATIQGGTLNTLNGATFENIGNSTTLDGSTQGAITLNGTFTGAGGSQTTLFGTFNNNGNIQLNGGGGTNTYGLLTANTTLQGSGSGLVTLNNTVSGGGNTFLYSNNGALTLTNTNNTIQGAGIIGNGTALTIVNSTGGTILANLPGQTLLLNAAAPLTNNGTLEATAGGVGTGATTLQVTSPFTNFSGNTLTGGTYIVNGVSAQGTLQINAFGTTGGEVVNNAANIVLNGPTSSIVDANGLNALTNLAANSTSGSSFTLEGGQNFTTSGNFTNNGTLVVGAGSVFDVNGNLTNITGTTIAGGTYDLTGVLKANNASGITINDANITLTGTGALENQSGANALTGLVTNDTGATFTLSGGATFTDMGAFTNDGTLTVTGTGSKFSSVANYTNAGTTTLQTGGTFDQTASGTLSGAGTFTNGGTLEATGGAVLDLQNSVANTGGTILATGAGSEVVLDGATITSGTLTSAAGGLLIGENNAVLNGSSGGLTISTGSTLDVNSGQTLDAKGTITNNGIVSLNSGELLLTGNTTLAGTGKVTLSNSASNLIAGSTSAVVLTNNETIQGAGSIGSVATPIGIVNKKTITANQSTPLIINTSAAGLDNMGTLATLSVSTGDTMEINGTLTNFASGTLTGGIYNVSGTLDLPAGDNITTNAATISLTGAAAEIKNPAGSGSNALDALASNSSTGKLTLSNGQILSDSATAFTNAGTLTIKTGSKLNLTAATATYTQTAGTTTVDGNLTAKGGITFNGGSEFGKNGTLNAGATGTVTNNATFNVGDAVMTAGKESITGKYTQTSTGALDIDIGGTTAGTQFDQLTISGAATLNGTLNLDLINGFIPTTSDTFDILNASSLGSTMFSTVNGLTFNGGTEEFQVIYNSNNVTLDVVNVARDGLALNIPPSDFALNISTSNLVASNSAPLNTTPEPGSLILLGSGLLGMAIYMRRRASIQNRA